jgi:hypothetical protein
MDHCFLEGLAIAAYERNGFDPSRPVDTFRLARADLGSAAVQRPADMVGPPSSFGRGAEDRYWIAVKRSLPVMYARFFGGHEYAHVLLDREGYAEEDLELCCDYLGAALMAPRPAMYGLQRAFRFDDYSNIAAAVGSTQTWAALRCAEVLRVPVAVVAPRVRVRGPEEWVWPDERTLRSWARRPPSGLAKTRLSDSPGRVVLTADDLEQAV